MSNLARASSPLQPTPKQLALYLFALLAADDLPIEQANHDIGFPRHNNLTEVSNLDLAPLKALDAIAFIVAAEPAILARYDVDLAYIHWLMQYGETRNTKHFPAVITALQQETILTRTTREGREDWTSVPLLGPAGVKGSRFIFDMAPELQRQLKFPSAAHWLSLRAAVRLNSQPAKMLYNYLLRNGAEGVTPWVHWTEIQALPGPKYASVAELYKDYRKATLAPVLAQINSRTDLAVTLETRGIERSNKVDLLRFRVARNPEAAWVGELAARTDLKTALEGATAAFGLNQANLDEIHAGLAQNRWSPLKVVSVIQYVHDQLKAQPSLRSPGGYFMTGLRGNWVVQDQELIRKQQQEQLDRSRQREQQARQREAALSEEMQQDYEAIAHRGWAYFQKMAAEEQSAQLAAFAKSLIAKSALARVQTKPANPAALSIDYIQSEPTVSRAFGQFVAKAAIM